MRGIREKTPLLPRSCAFSRHLMLVGVSSPTCQPPATGKGSLRPRLYLSQLHVEKMHI